MPALDRSLSDCRYHHRDTLGVGLCSWTGGMESGMDDGIRFSLAGHASNATSGISSFNFHSIDLNAYLYKEKRTLAKMATVLGNSSGAAHWTAGVRLCAKSDGL